MKKQPIDHEQLQKALRRLWTTDEVARRYRVHPTTVWLWRNAGLPAITLSPRMVRFDPVVVRNWVRLNRPRML